MPLPQLRHLALYALHDVSAISRVTTVRAPIWSCFFFRHPKGAYCASTWSYLLHCLYFPVTCSPCFEIASGVCSHLASPDASQGSVSNCYKRCASMPPRTCNERCASMPAVHLQLSPLISHFVLFLISQVSAFQTLSYLSEGAIFIYVGLDALDPLKWAVRFSLLPHAIT